MTGSKGNITCKCTECNYNNYFCASLTAHANSLTTPCIECALSNKMNRDMIDGHCYTVHVALPGLNYLGCLVTLTFHSKAQIKLLNFGYNDTLTEMGICQHNH